MAKYYYVSSWTDDSMENIPLWYMYTNRLRGVRIEADSDFVSLETDEDDRITNITNKDLIAFPCVHEVLDDFLVPVNYADEIEPCITNVRGFINSDAYNAIGRTKPTAWRFQNEVRFRIRGIEKSQMMKSGDNEFIKFSNSIMHNKPNRIAFADIEFRISNLINANFMLGLPLIKQIFEELESLVNKYIPDFKGELQKSNIHMRFITKS